MATTPEDHNVVVPVRLHGLTDTRRSWHWRGDKPIDTTILGSAA
jgi:hypothetical protein